MKKLIFLLVLLGLVSGCGKEFVGKTYDLNKCGFNCPFHYCRSDDMPCYNDRKVGDFQVSYTIRKENNVYIFEGTAKLLSGPFGNAEVGDGNFRLLLLAKESEDSKILHVFDSIIIGFRSKRMGNIKLYKEFTAEQPFHYTALSYRLKSY